MSKQEWDALTEDEKDEMGAMLDFQAAEDRRENPEDYGTYEERNGALYFVHPSVA